MSRSTNSGIGEFAAIELLRQELDVAPPARGEIGIGDDAAVLDVGGKRLVWSVDASVEGVHFDRRWLSLRQAASRAFVAALSDLAAMGAMPRAALCALGLPPSIGASQVRAIGRGQAAVAAQYRCPMLGGNVTRDERISFTTTVLGVAERVVERRGARVGDEVWLCGRVGEAAAGLELLRGGRSASNVGERRCVKAWRSPRALFDEAHAVAPIASSLVDVSDGLASEAEHIAQASGVCLKLDERALAAACSRELARTCERLGRRPLDLMLFGGEDYALLVTGPKRRRPLGACPIGSVVEGSGAWLETASGLVRIKRGFDHLRQR